MRVSVLNNGLKPMNKPDYISIDKAFQDNLGSHEMPFQNGDWDDMLSKLDSDDGAILLPPDKHIFTNFKHITIMILITTLTAGLMWMSTPQEQASVIITEATPNKIITALAKSERPDMVESVVALPTEQETGERIINQAEINLQSFVESLSLPQNQTPEVLPSQRDISPLSDIDMLGATPEKDIEAPDTAKFLKNVVSKYWVDTTYTYLYHPPSRDIEDGWIGLYYTNQQLTDAYDWERIGRHTETHGFNLQFMSGNILPGENFAIYAGIDWGMQFYGRSESSEVLINSVNEDRGLTFLRSHSNDLYFSGQIEWAQFPIVPYIHGSAGGRILTTAQTTRALLSSADYESTQENGVHTRAALSTKYGVGAKLRITPRMYLDARYSIVNSRSVETVDYNNTSFNGLDYDLGRQKLNMNAGQVQFGVVFDVSSETRTKVIDEPGHWEERTQTLYVDPTDSTKVFVPCPCEKSKRNARVRNNSSNRRFPNFEDGIFTPDAGSGSGSGSGKGSFPGLKKPPVRW